MFPIDTLYVAIDDDTHATGVILPAVTYPRTLLYGTLSCKLATNNIIENGTQTIFQSKSNSNIYKFLHNIVPAGNEVTFSKGNLNDQCFFSFLYVNRDMSISTEATTTTATTTVKTISGFTYGEALIIFILLLIFTHQFFMGLKEWIFGKRIENPTKNKYNLD